MTDQEMTYHTAKELPARPAGQCDCYMCRMSALFREISEDTPRYRRLLNNVLESYEAESTEACYYRSIINGDWPNSIAPFIPGYPLIIEEQE